MHVSERGSRAMPPQNYLLFAQAINLRLRKAFINGNRQAGATRLPGFAGSTRLILPSKTLKNGFFKAGISEIIVKILTFSCVLELNRYRFCPLSNHKIHQPIWKDVPSTKKFPFLMLIMDRSLTAGDYSRIAVRFSTREVLIPRPLFVVHKATLQQLTTNRRWKELAQMDPID